jgi:Ca-activated chloride channel family protein
MAWRRSYPSIEEDRMMLVTRSRLTTLAAAVALVAVAAMVRPATTQAAGMLIADGGLGGVLTIEEHTARVTINNGVAVTEVTQVFRNTENRQVEALYLFPVPEGATVANFSMWIGGKEMIGEVVEKERAREIYNSYKRVRRDPGLLEQVDYKNFEMRIFPIEANAEQRVQIAYYQELNFDHDWATYVYPLATAPRAGIDAKVTGKFGLTMHVKSAVPIVKIESPSHGEEFVTVQHGDKYIEASLETEGGDLDRDLVLSYHVSRPQTGIDVITSRTGDEDGYFLLTLTAGEELAEAYSGMDYVFLLDISGSMANDGKLRVSRESIDAFVRSLSPEDRFEVVTFNVAPTTLFNELRPAGDESLTAAVEFLESQQGRGGTKLRPAMSIAYKYADADRPLNVVVLSDGMTEQSERQELLGLIGSRPAGARVFCVGVGNDVNRPLLGQIADEAGGLSAFLSAGDNFQRQAESFRRKLLRPAAANVKINFSGGDVYDVEPQQLPNLYHGMPVRLYGRYRSAGKVDVQVSADINGAPLDQTAAVELPKSETANPEIERMWALEKVNRLLRTADRGGNRGGVTDEIVRLGETYSIVTEYTSFLVLENDAEYKRWQIDRRNLLRLGRDRQGQQQVRADLQRMREEARADLGPQQKASQNPVNNTEQSQASTRASTPDTRNSRSRDLNFAPTTPSGGGGGGGAIDPISGGIVLTLAGLGAAARRRRKRAALSGDHRRGGSE